MKEFKEIIEGLKDFVSTDEVLLTINDCVDYLNNEYSKIEYDLKKSFIVWLKANLKSFDNDCIYEIPDDKTEQEYIDSGIRIIHAWFIPAIECFIAKESMDLIEAVELYKDVKRYVKDMVYSDFNSLINTFREELKVIPSTLRKSYLIKKHKEVFEKLKFVTNNADRDWSDTVFNPLENEHWSISNLLDGVYRFKKELN